MERTSPDTTIPDQALLNAIDQWSRTKDAFARHRIRDLLRSSVLLVPTVRNFTQIADKDRLFRPGFPLSTLTGRAGHKAVLAFTGYEAMKLWRPSGYYSIAIPSQRLCALARQPDIDLLAIDLAGPAAVRLNRNDLNAILDGQTSPFGEPMDLQPAAEWSNQRTPTPSRTPTALNPSRPSLRLREAIEVYGTFRTPENRAVIYDHLLSGALLLQLGNDGRPVQARDDRGNGFLPVHTHDNNPATPLTPVSALDTIILASELGATGLLLNPHEDAVVLWRGEVEALRAGDQPDPQYWHNNQGASALPTAAADF